MLRRRLPLGMAFVMPFANVAAAEVAEEDVPLVWLALATGGTGFASIAS